MWLDQRLQVSNTISYATLDIELCIGSAIKQRWNWLTLSDVLKPPLSAMFSPRVNFPFTYWKVLNEISWTPWIRELLKGLDLKISINCLLFIWPFSHYMKAKWNSIFLLKCSPNLHVREQNYQKLLSRAKYCLIWWNKD